MTHLWVRAEQRLNEERVGLMPGGAKALIEKGIRDDYIVLVGHCSERVGTSTHDGHSSACFGERQGSRCANAGASTGHDNMAIGQTHDGFAIWAARSALRHSWSRPAS